MTVTQIWNAKLTQFYSNKMRFYYMVLRGRNFCFIIDL